MNMQMIKIKQILIFISLFGAAGLTSAASYNCSKAQSRTEIAVCDDLKLNDADVKMAATYSIIKRLVPMGTRGAIQDEQFKWLALRDQCQDNTSCLNDVYKMRQQKLEQHLERVYRKGPF